MKGEDEEDSVVRYARMGDEQSSLPALGYSPVKR